MPSNWLEMIGGNPIVRLAGLSLTKDPLDTDGTEVAVHILNTDNSQSALLVRYGPKYTNDEIAAQFSASTIDLSVSGRENIIPAGTVSNFVITLISLEQTILGDSLFITITFSAA